MNSKLFIRVILVGILAKILVLSINYINPGSLSLAFVKSVWLLEWLMEMFLYFLIARDYKTNYRGKPIAIYMYIFLSLIIAVVTILSRGTPSEITILRIARLLLFIIVAIQLYVTKYKAFILLVILSHIIVSMSPLLLSHLTRNANLQIYQLPYVFNILPDIMLLVTIIQLKKSQKQIEDDINAIGTGTDR